MTQEELDALMNGVDDITDESLPAQQEQAVKEADEYDSQMNEALEKYRQENGDRDYRVDAASSWPPPPPTQDHKMVQQLDDVTRESEEKATELFDKLETINNFLMDSEGLANDAIKIAKKSADLFATLHEKFPNVAIFGEMIEAQKELNDKLNAIIQQSQDGQDTIMMTMDMMQYQDINRQRIERVINVMRALSKYMNSLFESSVNDEKRVSSAVYIAGDTNNDSVVDNDEIEALIEQLGKKK